MSTTAESSGKAVIEMEKIDDASFSSDDDVSIHPTCDLTPKEIERLGRIRPAVFPTLVGEVFFICIIVLSLMMSEYFTSGFNILLPDLSVHLQISPTIRIWPTAAPNLATAALLLPFARLCDQKGSRVIFLLGHAWLLVWSFIGGFSTNAIMMIMSRTMQGIGCAALLPAGMALLGNIYRPGPRKNLIYCIYGAFACVGFYFGIFMAALSAQYLNWRWYFWIGAIIQLIIVVGGWLTIPRNLGDVLPQARMDWPGLCTIVPGLALLVYSLSAGSHAAQGWKTPYIYVCSIVGTIFLCAAVYTQGWFSAQPFLPSSIFRPRYMKRLYASLFCYYGVFSLFLFYGSLYIEDILLASPIKAAVWYTPLAVGGMILAIAGGVLLHVVSGYILMLISSLGFLFSVLLFAVVPPGSESSTTHTYWAYIFPAMCCGTIGMDIMFNVTNVFLTSALPKRDQATAGAVINSLMCLGIAFWLGVSEVAVSMAHSLSATEVGLLDQYKVGFWVAVALSGVALCLTATVRLSSASADMTADEREIQQHKAKDVSDGA